MATPIWGGVFLVLLSLSLIYTFTWRALSLPQIQGLKKIAALGSETFETLRQ